MVFATVAATHSVHSSLLQCKQHGAQNPFDLENPNQLWNYTCSSGGGAGAAAAGAGGALGVPVHSWGAVAGVSSTHAATVKGAFGVGKNGVIPNSGHSPFGASGAHGWVTVGTNATVFHATAAANSAAAAAGTGVHAAVTAHAVAHVPIVHAPPPPPPHPVHAPGGAGRAVERGTHAAAAVSQAPANPGAPPAPPPGMPTGATSGSSGIGIKPHQWVTGTASAAKPHVAAGPKAPVIEPSGVVVGMHGGVLDSHDDPVVNGPPTGFSSNIDREIGIGNGFMN